MLYVRFSTKTSVPQIKSVGSFSTVIVKVFAATVCHLQQVWIVSSKGRMTESVVLLLELFQSRK